MPLNDVLRHRTHTMITVLNSHRILLYTAASFLAVSVAVANALRNYSNFYSVAISLSKSNRSVLALANFGFLFSLLCGHIIQRIFFGSLRANEVERLYDRLWFFITESLLAFTIFRDEFDIPFALMFGFLLFVKSFHWLAGDRIEWMDQRPYPGPPPLFHLRMTVLFILLWMIDFLMFLIAVENTIANGVGGMVLFASEYGILMASVLNTISKYLLSTYELRRAGRRGGENAPPWENKSMWTFYIELATDFLKLTTYLIFFIIIITFYGLPLNIIRDVYITARSFVTRLRALHRYQTATRNMDQRYPNATADELTAMSDHTCIICREEMLLHVAAEGHAPAPAGSDGPNTTPKKLPCGHIFHFHCLRSWLERQQSCPTCRRTVLDIHPQGQDGTGAPGPARVEPQGNNQIPVAGRNQNNGRGNNPLGNPLGLVGRLFGPPVQPPAAPGQPGQLLQNLPQNPGYIAGQLPQGVVIQYHIQYQIPRNQDPNPLPALAPPPQFPGFPGPGGGWQPWPQDANAAQGHNPEPPNSTNASPTPTIDPQRTSSSSTSSAVPSQRDDSPASTREAAALAASRRISGANVRSPASSISLPNGAQTVAHDTSTAVPSRLPLTESVGISHSENNSGGVPALIPLYDYTEISGQSTTSLGSRTTRATFGSTESPRILTHSSQSAQQPSHRRTATSSLPPTLTNDQLVIMDRLTREAIDERLRVLEGVSGSIYHCIDDLMRMRSTLPSPNATGVPSQATSSVPTVNPDLRNGVAKGPHPPVTTTTSDSNGTANNEATRDVGTVLVETEEPQACSSNTDPTYEIPGATLQ